MREIGVKKHSWLSNPLDWVHIDRMILLAVMVLLIPLFFGSVLALCLVFTPNWLHPRTALFLLAVYAGYAVALALFIAAAFRRRKTNERWSLFENFIIASYVIVVFLQAWLSGTHFTGGMLLMMIGVYMTSALADIRKIFRAHIAVAVLFVAVCFAEGSGRLQYAPLFAKPPIHPDGSSTPVWFAVQIAQLRLRREHAEVRVQLGREVALVHLEEAGAPVGGIEAGGQRLGDVARERDGLERHLLPARAAIEDGRVLGEDDGARTRLGIDAEALGLFLLAIAGGHVCRR